MTLYPDVPWDKMGAMRNVLIHEYSGVDAEVIRKNNYQGFAVT